MGRLVALAVAASLALLFRFLYRYFEYLGLGPITPPFLSRYTSCVHAVLLVLLGMLWTSVGDDPLLRGAWVYAACAVPLGYLAHDTHLLLTEASLKDPPTVVHHFVFACLVLVAAPDFPDHTAQAFLAEASVPFLHAGWVMIKTGANKKYPRLFNGISLALLVTFLWLRVKTFSAFTLEAYARSEWAILAPLAGLTALNWFWFSLLLLKAYRVVQREPATGGPATQ